jgi:hypothetical protein
MAVLQKHVHRGLSALSTHAWGVTYTLRYQIARLSNYSLLKIHAPWGVKQIKCKIQLLILWNYKRLKFIANPLPNIQQVKYLQTLPDSLLKSQPKLLAAHLE